MTTTGRLVTINDDAHHHQPNEALAVVMLPTVNRMTRAEVFLAVVKELRRVDMTSAESGRAAGRTISTLEQLGLIVFTDESGLSSEPTATVPTESEEIVFPDDMDAECIPICIAMNRLPGIRTVESCCGHDRTPFQVFFVAERIESLFPLLRAMEDSAWGIEVYWVNGLLGGGGAMFMLEGPAGPPDMDGGANAFTSWITDNQP